MPNIILIFSLVLLTLSCTKNDIPDGKGHQDKDSLAATSYLDVKYGDDVQQRLDVYLPALRNSKTSLVVVIHGGGWTAGDKSDFNPLIAELQKRLPGYAFANLNYRLATTEGNYFPTQENDIETAIKFLKNKTNDYALSQDFIFVGISAGAHLAMLQGYKHSDVLQPKGIVSYYGPADLQRLYIKSDSTIPWVLKNITNATPEINPTIFSESSPINYVTSTAAPTLLLHGDADKLVPLEQATMLHKKLDELGISNNLIVYPGQGHGWEGPDLVDSFNKVKNFILSLED